LPKEASRLALEAAWVMGEQTADTQLADTANLFQTLREHYLRAYIRHWDEYLKDIRLRNPDNFEQAIEFNRMLASSQSPLKKFLEEVTRNTRLAPGEVGKLPVENSLEKKVDEHFSALNNLLDGKSPTYPQVAGLFSELYSQLAAIHAARNSGNAPPAQGALDSILVSSGLMPDPVPAIAAQLVAQGGAQGQLAERANLSADLQPVAEVCRRTVANRYPVLAGSGLDIMPDDFNRFFGAGGLMDQFFESRLAGRVDTGGTIWKLKNSTGSNPAVKAASQIQQFQNAARIREAFFQGTSSTPKFDIEMRLLNASPANDVFYLEIDGELKMFSAQHQPVHKVRWGGQATSSLLRVRASEGEYKSFHGPWALFRLFDTGKAANASRPELFQIRFELQGKSFDFEVRANSVFNPLRLKELRQFRCPVAL
ncbi:MAG TPA: ImcF-related family protein, partial [Limnobacter sp.]|nr:ImcF-related family protein [Limnobacter sp.]